MRNIVKFRHGPFAFVAVGMLLASVSIAEVYEDQKCEPIAAPVAGCECPNSVFDDWCEGQLPKPTPGMYGDVMCMSVPGTCVTSPNGANDCGIVYNCPGSPCGSLYVGVQCVPFPSKPPCSGRWGQCALGE